MTVNSASSLARVTPDQFGLGSRAAFASATASTHNLPAADVTVTGVAASASGRRRLHQSAGGIRVTYAMLVPAQQSTALQASVAAVAASPTAFMATLNTALAAAPDYSGPALTEADLAMEPAVEAAPPPPPPPPAPLSATAAAAESVASAAAAALFSSNTSSSNTSAAVAAVTSALGNLSAVDLAGAQNALLSSFAASNVTSNPSASASVVLAVLSVGTGGAVLSQDSQAAALSVLSSISAAPVNASSGAVQSVASALTLLAASASATSNGAALVQVAAVQSSLLAGLAAQNATANPAAAAAAVGAVVSAAPGVVLSSSAIGSALSVLNTVSDLPVNLTSGTGTLLVDALSNITSSASAVDPAALGAITRVVDNLQTGQADALVRSANASALRAPISVTISSASIQSLVQLSPPGSPPAVLSAPGALSAFQPIPEGLLPSTTPVVATFLALTFNPHSPAASGNATGRRRLRQAPPGGSAVATVGGITRLAFSNPDGSPIEVANASSPVLFTMPPVTLPDASGAQAACSFWDTAAGAYSTAGCIAVPSPAPPNHTLGFLPGYTTPDDASLAGAWFITGPLVDETCSTQVIDCGSDAPCTGAVWGANCTIFPNPRLPLGPGNGAVACPACPGPQCPPTGPPVLRVVYGAECALWQNNTLGCSWNNTNQTFTGPGCVASPGSTRCMCRHLTDFASARVPQLTTCSLSQMVGLNPADIVNQLRFLFIVVCCLFALMNGGAAVAFVMDMQHKSHSVARIKTPEMGFTQLPDGTWLWSTTQDELDRAVAAPSGSAVNFTALFGFPFIRLRCALPEELMRGSIGQALGRRLGLSAGGLSEAKEEHHNTFTQLRRNSSTLFAARALGSPRASESAGDAVATSLSLVSVDWQACEGDGSPTPRAEALFDASETPRARMSTARSFGRASRARFSLADMSVEASELTGSALAFAYLASQRALPYDELNARLAATARHFRGCRVPGIAHDFMQLHRLFSLMVGFDSGSIAATKQWLTTSRLWRLILLQQEDGGWNLTGSLAFVVESHPGELPKKVKKVEATVWAKLCGAVWMGDEEDLDAALDDLDDMVDDVVRLGADGSPGTGGAKGAPDDVAVDDCPLTFSRGEMLRRMPKLLAQTDGGERLWATSLAVEVLRNMDVSWLVCDEEGEEETIVDKGVAYLQTCCGQHPALAEFVTSGELKAYTKRTIRHWRAVTDAAVQRTRYHEVTSAHVMLTYAQRAGAHIFKSLRVDHSTFSVFLDSDSFLLRWQSWMLLLTVVASSLLTSIWFYSSRATQCCAEIRTLLDVGAGGSCSAAANSTSLLVGSSASYLLDGGLGSTCSPATPQGVCLGYMGDCSDLAGQFSTLQGAYIYSPTVQCSSTPDDPSCLCQPTLADYVCHAFPDDAYTTDQFFVGLICVAVALPVSLVLEHLFELANLTDEAEGWLEWGGVLKLVMGITAHRKWQWASKKRPTDLIIWLTSVYPEAAPYEFLMFFSWWIPKQLLPGVVYRFLAAALGGGGEEGKEEGEAEGGEKPAAAEVTPAHHQRAALPATSMLGDECLDSPPLLTVRVPTAHSAAGLAPVGEGSRADSAPASPHASESGGHEDAEVAESVLRTSPASSAPASPRGSEACDQADAHVAASVPRTSSAASFASAGHECGPAGSAAASPRVSEAGGVEESDGSGPRPLRPLLPDTPMQDAEPGDAPPLALHVPRVQSAASLASVGRSSPGSSSACLYLTESPTTVLLTTGDIPRVKPIAHVHAAVDAGGKPGGSAADEEEVSSGETGSKVHHHGGKETEKEEEAEDEREEEEEEEEAITSRQARTYAAIGYVGVYVTWAVFSWCVPRRSLA